MGYIMSIFNAIRLIDQNGAAKEVLMEDGCPTTRDYLIAIGERDISNHVPWSKIGYTPYANAADFDIWSWGGTGGTTNLLIPFPTAAAQWKVVAANANDTGTKIHGNAEGANQTILCDNTGSTIALIDADVDFTAGTSVAVGDIVLLSPKGNSSTAALTPEWGYVSGLTGTHQIDVSGGFSSGGTCAAARAYTIVDQSTAGKGALVVKIEYLTNTFAERSLLVVLNGGTQNINGSGGAALTDTYRVNSFRVVGMGVLGVSQGTIQVQSVAASTVYTNITAGYTRARNIAYTVPYGKQLYINKIDAAFGANAANKQEYCRIYTRANREPSTGFFTGTMFYPYSEVVLGNGTVIIELKVPTKFATGTDLKVSGFASGVGVASVALRGWLETI
jgi:hypothetical protein